MAGFRRDDPNNLALNVLDINLDHLDHPSPITLLVQPGAQQPYNSTKCITKQKTSRWLSYRTDPPSCSSSMTSCSVFTYAPETELLEPRGLDLAERRSGAAVFIWEDEEDVLDCSMLD